MRKGVGAKHGPSGLLAAVQCRGLCPLARGTRPMHPPPSLEAVACFHACLRVPDGVCGIQGEYLWTALGLLGRLTANIVDCGNTLEKYR